MADTESEGEFESADEGETQISTQAEKVHDTPSNPPDDCTVESTEDVGHSTTFETCEEQSEKCLEDEKDDIVCRTSIGEDTSNEPEPKPHHQSDSSSSVETLQKVALSENSENNSPAVPSSFDRLAEKNSSGGGGWGSWSSWGASWGSSVLSVAKTSVSTLGKELADGITQVSSTVEAALDVPDPETIAHENKKATENAEASAAKDVETDKDVDDENGGWGIWSDSWSSWGEVQKTGLAVVSGGLGALESLGKKTMDVLQEHDPGLKNTKALLTGERPSLSQRLKEAREKEEAEQTTGGTASVDQGDTKEEVRQKDFGALFEEEAGAVHLEALELLSSQCEAQLAGRVASLKGKASRNKRRQLGQIKEALESVRIEDNDEDDDEEEYTAEDVEEKLKEALAQLSKVWTTASGIGSKILAAHADAVDAEGAGAEDDEADPEAVHHMAVRLLAVLTACVVEQLHRIGQLALTKDGKVESWSELSRGVSAVCRACRCEASRIAQSHVTRLRGCPDAAHAVTGVLLEAANSRSYMEDATVKLCPVLQLASLPPSAVAES